MNTIPQDIDTIRSDMRRKMLDNNIHQIELQRIYGVSQGIISNFLSGRRGISYKNILRLWPFIYGNQKPITIIHSTEVVVSSTDKATP